MKTAFDVFYESQTKTAIDDMITLGEAIVVSFSPTIEKAMKLYAEQALDLAAEKATSQYSPNFGISHVNKDSILSLKDQLK